MANGYTFAPVLLAVMALACLLKAIRRGDGEIRREGGREVLSTLLRWRANTGWAASRRG